MRHHTQAARRFAWLISLVAMLAAAALPAAAQAKKDSVKVMTRNLYLGTGLNGLLGVTAGGIPGAAAVAWGNVVATDYPTRADALAAEIQASGAQIVGLQEVEVWSEGFPDTFTEGNFTPNASTEVYEFLDLLIARLSDRGLTFSAESTSLNADVELPRLDFSPPWFPPLPLIDTRLTDRDVILVRSDVVADVSNPDNGLYTDQLNLSAGGLPVEFTRGWTSVDIALNGGSFRFFNTHLETEVAPPVQVAQGNEALGILDETSMPVVAVGDFNSDARGTTTATYTNLLAGGLKDVVGGTGPSTCCQSELLTNKASENATRIDLILTRGPFSVKGVGIVGNTRFRSSPSPLWASDHAGMVAEVGLK